MVQTRIRVILSPRPLEAGDVKDGADNEGVTPILDALGDEEDDTKDGEGEEAEAGVDPELEGAPIEEARETPDTP
jgi:hypothetical protein